MFIPLRIPPKSNNAKCRKYHHYKYNRTSRGKNPPPDPFPINIFKSMTGYLPDEVQHVDGDITNNSWLNLELNNNKEK
jgi:hypothetical protein